MDTTSVVPSTATAPPKPRSGVTPLHDATGQVSRTNCRPGGACLAVHVGGALVGGAHDRPLAVDIDVDAEPGFEADSGSE